MVIKVKLNESTSADITNFLQSDEIFRLIDTSDCFSACQSIVDLCDDMFENIVLPEVKRVQVVKVDKDYYNVVDSNYYVIKYNNKFYDYCAADYFSDLFKINEVPVIQPVLSTFNLIHSTVSTVKNYVLISR